MSCYLSYLYWFAKVEGDGRVSLPIGGAHGLEVAVNAHVWSLVQVLFLTARCFPPADVFETDAAACSSRLD